MPRAFTLIELSVVITVRHRRGEDLEWNGGYIQHSQWNWHAANDSI